MRPVAISILFLLLVNCFGFYLAFECQRAEIRSGKRLQGNAQAPIMLILMTQAEFQNIYWIKNGRELLIDGELYDVDRIEVSDDRVQLYVKHDEPETKLVADFIKSMKEEKDATSTWLPIHFLKEFCFAHTDANFLFEDHRKILSLWFRSPYLPVALDVATPPPDRA